MFRKNKENNGNLQLSPSERNYMYGPLISV